MKDLVIGGVAVPYGLNRVDEEEQLKAVSTRVAWWS